MYLSVVSFFLVPHEILQGRYAHVYPFIPPVPDNSLLPRVQGSSPPALLRDKEERREGGATLGSGIMGGDRHAASLI